MVTGIDVCIYVGIFLLVGKIYDLIVGLVVKAPKLA